MVQFIRNQLENHLPFGTEVLDGEEQETEGLDLSPGIILLN